MTQIVATTLPAMRPQAITAEYVHCAKCGKVLGEVSYEHGRTLLRIGGLSLIVAEGQCANCKADFRWTASKRALDRLLKHYPKPIA